MPLPRTARLVLLQALLFSSGVAAQTASSASSPAILYQPDPDSPIGEMNPAAPPETAQYAFLIGDWDVDIELNRPAGVLRYDAAWHNTWIVDGHVVMQEWRGPYATGAEIRSYVPALGRWEGRNVYAGRQTFTNSTATWEGDRMVVLTESTGPQGDFIGREVYFDITEDRWEMRADQSFDGGVTWSDWTYRMVSTRRR